MAELPNPLESSLPSTVCTSTKTQPGLRKKHRQGAKNAKHPADLCALAVVASHFLGTENGAGSILFGTRFAVSNTVAFSLWFGRVNGCPNVGVSLDASIVLGAKPRPFA